MSEEFIPDQISNVCLDVAVTPTRAPFSAHDQEEIHVQDENVATLVVVAVAIPSATKTAQGAKMAGLSPQ